MSWTKKPPVKRNPKIIKTESGNVYRCPACRKSLLPFQDKCSCGTYVKWNEVMNNE